MSAECDVIAMEDREDIEVLERFHAEDDGFRIPHAIVQLKIHGTGRNSIFLYKWQLHMPTPSMAAPQSGQAPLLILSLSMTYP